MTYNWIPNSSKMTQSIILLLISSLIFSIETQGTVHVRNKCVHPTRTESYQISYPGYKKIITSTTYRLHCGYLFCNTRRINVYGHRQTTFYRAEYRSTCCDGYARENGECFAVCNPPCYKGACVRPNECECDKGYTGTVCGAKDQTSRTFCNAIDHLSAVARYAYRLPRSSCGNNLLWGGYALSLTQKIIADQRLSPWKSHTPLYEFYKQHRILRDVCCYSETNYHITYLQQLINFDDDFYNLVNGLTSTHAPNLREEIKDECSTANLANPFCAFKPIIPIVDMAAQLPSSKSQWTEKNRIDACIISIKTFLLKRSYSDLFSNLETNEGSILVQATNYIIKFILENEMDYLRELTLSLSSVLSSVNLCSEKIQDFCIFSRVIKDAIAYVEEATSRRVVRIGGKRIMTIHTGTDYAEYLKQKQLDRILRVLRENRYTATEIANDLKRHMTSKFSQVRDYYRAVETFNSKIASADIGYINGRLDLFKSRLAELLPKLSHDFGDLLTQGFIVAGSDVAQGIVKTALAIASAANPLKHILGGGAAADVIDTMTDLALAISRVVKMARVGRTFGDLKVKTQFLYGHFQLNAVFLENVKKLVEKDYTKDEFNTVKDIFIQQYNDYNPQVTKEQLLESRALWDALIEATCSVIDDADSIPGAAAKSYAEDKGYCIDIPVLVERLFTVYEEIYDYQFDLISALAAYMRTLVAIDATENIDETFVEVAGLNPEQDSTLSKLSLMGGLSFITYKTQILKIINLYCDREEYERAGRRPSECNGANTNLALLFNSRGQTCGSEVHTFYYNVPTKPADENDRAYVDLERLFSGEVVEFKIPDANWMVQREWISDSEKNYAFYVQEFEIYLPIEPELGIQTFITTADSIQNNAISPGGAEYIITPPVSLTSKFRMSSYDQSCKKVKAKNPYTICENSGIREICPVSMTTRHLYPSIYSLWHLSVDGGKTLTLPNPATDLNLVFGLRLCEKNPGSLVGQELFAEVQEVEVGDCCPTGQYRPTLSSPCTSCPANSHSALAGYYCEKDKK